MAVLEAFVYDPLLNWRLIDNKPKSKKSKTHGEVLLRITLIGVINKHVFRSVCLWPPKLVQLYQLEAVKATWNPLLITTRRWQAGRVKAQEQVGNLSSQRR